MQHCHGTLVFAPTDLTRWSASPYASWMARYAIERPDGAPAKDEPDPLLSRLATRGLSHEEALEARFAREGKTVVNVASRLAEAVHESGTDGHAAAIGLTQELLRAGTDVIAQATLERGSFRGHADFLVKVPGASDLGDFHYEVWDTKLARRVKPGMVLQLCCYVDMLESIQDRQANDIVVALGNGRNERVPLNDCFDYYLAVKAAFLQTQADWSADREPDPAAYANHGDWSGNAAQALQARDHPGRVARITRRQIERLEAAGIATMSALADAAGRDVPGIDAARMDWLVRQAALQCASANADKLPFHLVEAPPEAKTGLTALPDASPLDVFFDIEGFPLDGDGLDYLWGCSYHDQNGEKQFRDWWGHDVRAERRAFEGFIDWVMARWRKDPSMHVYHYAPYEITACKRLMGTHGTREQELDDLLRHGVFVDLYAIVTHGLQIGAPNYSIKSVERLYRPGRDTDVVSGGDSVVVYDLWRDARQRGEDSDDWHESEVLAGIRDYNRDDCDSTLELCEWLRARRPVFTPEHEMDLPEPSELPDDVVRRQALRDRLLERADADAADDTARRRWETLAGTLEFHRREDKNAWWRYFHRMDPANDQLAGDPDCLDAGRRTERAGFKPTPKARNLGWEYRFDASQELKGLARTVHLKGTDNGEGFALKATVLHEHSELDAGRVVLQSKHEPPSTVTLVPDEIVRAAPIPDAIEAVVTDIESGTTERSALLDLLHRHPPRFRAHDGGPIVRSVETALDDTIAAVRALDNSCLVIQGPPGAGKSFTGARIIAALVADGRRVGIASNSHKAIDNLMLGVARHCAEHGIDAHCVRSKATSPAFDDLGIAVVENGKLSDEVRPGCVIGTTAWGFARADLADAFDVLVIDEAGQVALANLVAMSRAATNLVIMGDQRQLGQPTQGTHPADSGRSVLDYRLGDAAAVDPLHGIFLGTTWRLHPAVNAPISRHVYGGQLATAPLTAQRTLVTRGDEHVLDRDAGLVYLPVEHEGDQQSSQAEVGAIVEAVKRLTGRALRDANGETRPLALSDMMFVAPYNAQVARLQAALGEQARVGSVDRFQGQEAPVVFMSLCSSDATASPRGLGFLFDRNRLNVAVSRAQTLCVIVGHPRLAVTPVATLADLKRVNFVAALMAAGSPNAG